MLVKPMCFPVGIGNSQATKVRPTFPSPLRSSNYMMRRQLKLTRNNVRMRVVRSMQRRSLRRLTSPTHQVDFLELPWRNYPTAQRLTSQHFVCSCRCELCHPGKHLDVLRGSHTDIVCMDVNDIEDLWTDNGVKALPNRGEEATRL